MQTTAVPTATNTMRPAVPTALMEVLRCHGLNELSQKDPLILRQYQAVLAARISAHEALLKTNLQRGYTVQVREDLRYFQTIQDAISSLLTTEFNAK